MENDIVRNINEIFSPKARLGIMVILANTGESDFSTIKEQLALSDGNLGAHMRVLEDAGYVSVEKMFVKRRPKSVYRITEQGRRAFLAHLDQLESIIESINRKI